MILSKELRNAHLEIRSLKLKTAQLEHEIADLKDNIHRAAVQNTFDVILSKDDKIMDINFDDDIDYADTAPKELDITSTDIKVKKYSQNIDFSRLSERLKVDKYSDVFDNCNKNQVKSKETKQIIKAELESEQVKSEQVANKENRDIKETEELSRKVTFSESINESKTEGRGPKRLGARILQSKPIHVRDLLKK